MDYRYRFFLFILCGFGHYLQVLVAQVCSSRCSVCQVCLGRCMHIDEAIGMLPQGFTGVDTDPGGGRVPGAFPS